MPRDRFLVSIDGRDLELSNLDKLMYPAAGFTKGEHGEILQGVGRVASRFSKNSSLAGLIIGVFVPVLFAILVLVIQAKAHK